jgi:excinuclease UvrABC nuclease subunit
VFWAGTAYEVRNTSGKKTYGPYSTKEAATEAANLLNRMVPKSSLFE